jgi:uncharacterized protein YcfJ
MRKLIMVGGLAAALSLPLLAGPTAADAASCHSRKATGTILGGVGGALLGNAVSHGGGGAVVGGLGGAVVGHEIGKSGCRTTYRRSAYYRAAPTHRATRMRVYYDRYGQAHTTDTAYYR